MTEKGFLPLNFGACSAPVAERLLNVAVTRARRQVLLFASFDPSELRAEQTSSVGVKHLKSYLEMAASGSEALEADLKHEALAIFGCRRMTESISARLDAALTWGTENGRLLRTTIGIVQSTNLT